MSISLDQALPEKRATRRAFDRAAGFDAACFIHDTARERLLEQAGESCGDFAPMAEDSADQGTGEGAVGVVVFTTV